MCVQNQFDCIDLSGNNVIRLEGFPKLPRLKMLLCCNNRIATIAPGLERAHITSLMLSVSSTDALCCGVMNVGTCTAYSNT